VIAAELALIHRAAFIHERPWSGDEFASLLSSRFVRCLALDHGFALTRSLAGESELLTLAVDPAHQGKGIGRALMQNWLDTLPADTQTAFLEVAADNLAAVHLYQAFGFVEMARRHAYYHRNTAPKADALVMRRAVTHGQDSDSAPQIPKSG
jgi:[ribosomal protein S18]-alanine N-acetyltransferase